MGDSWVLALQEFIQPWVCELNFYQYRDEGEKMTLLCGVSPAWHRALPPCTWGMIKIKGKRRGC